jgi:predicted DNA-binding transcriptional regulator YafY
MNESIFYNVDAIHNGIAQDKQITFKYFEYTVEKKKSYRHCGRLYTVSPFALALNSENYYLIAHDAGANKIKHYRVDKMDSIRVINAVRTGREQYDKIDLAEYTKHTFGMYGGEKQRVTIEFTNNLAGVVLDRFGMDTSLIKVDAERFEIHVDVSVSPQFFGWVFGLNGDAVITAPEDVLAGFKAQIERNVESYNA